MKSYFFLSFLQGSAQRFCTKSVDNKKLLALNADEDVKERAEMLACHATNCALIKPYINLHHCVLAEPVPSRAVCDSSCSDITPHI